MQSLKVLFSANFKEVISIIILSINPFFSDKIVSYTLIYKLKHLLEIYLKIIIFHQTQIMTHHFQ